MTSELKPCPFCGGAELSSGGDDKFVGYFCGTCQAAGPNHYGSHDWNTRATPSADTLAELERYEFDRESGSTFLATDKSERAPNGEYVLYSEAAAVVAAEQQKTKDAEELASRMDRFAKTYLKHKNIHEKRADIAEAELAQIKAQEPVAWMYVNEDGECEQIEYDRSISEEYYLDPSITLLYAAPVSDSLKAENKRLREALISVKQSLQTVENRSDDCILIKGINQALNVESANDKG